MKKLALLLALALCTGLIAPLAPAAEEAAEKPAPIVTGFEAMTEFPERTVGLDCYDAMENGGAEVLDEGGKKIYNWGFSTYLGRENSVIGCGIIELSNDAHEGENAVHVKPTKAGRCDVGPYGTLIPGETYELTFWHKKLTTEGSLTLAALIYGKNKGVDLEYKSMRLNMDKYTKKDTWVQSGIRFVAPEYSNQLLSYFSFSGPGEILIDDVLLRCITDKMPVPDMPEKLPAISYFEITDPGFESVAAGQKVNAIPGWGIHGDATISDKYAHTGEKSLELYNPDTLQDAIGQWRVTGIEEGATYQLSAFVLNPSLIKQNFVFWLKWSTEPEYSDEPSHLLGTVKPSWKIPTSFEWQEYIGEFVAPKGAKSAQIHYRHRLSPGYLYMDDVSVYMVKAPDPVDANTDAIFYYSEWETGKAVAKPTYVTGDAAKYRTEFTFTGLSGETLLSQTFDGLTEELTFEFPISLMKEKGERYNVNMKVYDPEGALCQEEVFPVHRYDRPTYLGADGIFRKNGKEVPVIVGTGINMKHAHRNIEDGGVVALQLIGGDAEYNMTIEEKLDYHWERGRYVVLTCYSSTKTAGHEDMIESVRKTVAAVKDHPAVLGYKLADEPFQKRIPDEEMMAGYKAIRDIDPHHPVYIVENVQGSYDWLFRFCDYLDIDYYGNSPEKISEVMDLVQEASKGKKPYGLMLQFFPYGSTHTFPEFDRLRHMTYQGFFSGAYGYSYFTLGLYAGVTNNTIIGLDFPQWQETVEKWAPWERDFALGCFVTGEYKFVNYQKTEEYIWGTFTDGTDLYAIVLNRSDKAACHVDIPLQDGTGTLKVDGFSAVAMTGDTTRTLTGAGTLSLDLAPWEATVWKVTPTGAPLSAEHLKDTSFNDIISYPWAYNAITTLEEKGIVNRVSNEWYGPGENITRGDYAMFLVRTLGLSGEGENFADVKADAEYAKELAIGKAAGILNGVGDNKFNPEAQITRQDMMTMTSRALALSGNADLAGFSDAASISDYARVHVAAMVEKGLIKGNADGTINPLGNTTRAEAAVIMQRILNN